MTAAAWAYKVSEKPEVRMYTIPAHDEELREINALYHRLHELAVDTLKSRSRVYIDKNFSGVITLLHAQRDLPKEVYLPDASSNAPQFQRERILHFHSEETA